MAQQLNVDRVVRISVFLQSLAASRRNFGTLMIMAETDVITADELYRVYTGIDAVAADFGVSSDIYKACSLYFAQSPRPASVYVGKWIKADTPAILRGGILTSAEKTLSAWTAITDGAFDIKIAGTSRSLSGLDFSSATNLNGVASVIDTALSTYGADCVWDGDRFIITTTTEGEAASIEFATAPDSGTDISSMLKLTETTALPVVPGYNSETALEGVARLADKTAAWYGLMIADTTLTVADHLEVAGFIESATKSHIYGVTITDTRALDAAYTSDFASLAKDAKYRRSMAIYSENPYAIASVFGRMFTVNFSGSNTTITLKFKQLPGVVPEGLTETQANALTAKRCNVFVEYDNDTAILQEGVMSGDAYIDEMHGLDWLQNAAQTAIWNLLYQSKTKIPQTDSGVSQIVACLENVFQEATRNGLIAPGLWRGDGFGTLEQGDYLDLGYYIYAVPIDEQDQSEREQRKAPPIRCALKLKGAIHFVDVEIDVNR